MKVPTVVNGLIGVLIVFVVGLLAALLITGRNGDRKSQSAVPLPNPDFRATVRALVIEDGAARIEEWTVPSGSNAAVEEAFAGFDAMFRERGWNVAALSYGTAKRATGTWRFIHANPGPTIWAEVGAFIRKRFQSGAEVNRIIVSPEPMHMGDLAALIAGDVEVETTEDETRTGE